MCEVYEINIDMVSLEVKINVTALSVSIHIAHWKGQKMALNHFLLKKIGHRVRFTD